MSPQVGRTLAADKVCSSGGVSRRQPGRNGSRRQQLAQLVTLACVCVRHSARLDAHWRPAARRHWRSPLTWRTHLKDFHISHLTSRVSRLARRQQHPPDPIPVGPLIWPAERTMQMQLGRAGAGSPSGRIAPAAPGNERQQCPGSARWPQLAQLGLSCRILGAGARFTSGAAWPAASRYNGRQFCSKSLATYPVRLSESERATKFERQSARGTEVRWRIRAPPCPPAWRAHTPPF